MSSHDSESLRQALIEVGHLRQREALAQKRTAALADGTVMGLSHKTLPIHGVQFHPESIASEHGHQMLRNFLNQSGITP